jgi:predicted aconitase with swiveling domain
LRERQTDPSLIGNNPDLFNRDLTAKILCIPQTIGSSSAATSFMIVLEENLAPKAMLFANHIDSLAAPSPIAEVTSGSVWLRRSHGGIRGRPGRHSRGVV